MSGNIERVIDFLMGPEKDVTVVVMPDFFMDRLVNLETSFQDFCSKAKNIVDHKGGSIDQIVQTELRGGNAINVASALIALGAKVIPIVCTNNFGLDRIRLQFNQSNLDTSHVKIFPRASVTTALEFKTNEGKANVMLRDVGSLAEFSPEDLDETDYSAIENADYVCLFNWAGTRKFGTVLTEQVFQRGKRGKGKTYLDTADPAPNSAEASNLMERVLKKEMVDILSLNENEAVYFASMIDSKISEQTTKVQFNELALLSAQILAQHLYARIDLHTTSFSVTVTKNRAFFVPAFVVQPLRATGAGDAWDAGNLIGDAYGLPHEVRLTLANAVSACYLSDPEGVHPTKQKLIQFLKGAKITK